MVKERKGKFNDKIKKQKEIVELEDNIITLKKTIEKNKPQFEKTSTLFHTKAEVEGLYESLSEHAAVNGLVISKIEKKPNTIKAWRSSAISTEFTTRSNFLLSNSCRL